MEERKLNRIKVVLAEKDKTGRWLSEQIGKSNCTVSRFYVLYGFRRGRF